MSTLLFFHSRSVKREMQLIDVIVTQTNAPRMRAK